MTPTAAVRSVLGDPSGTLSEARCREVVVAVLGACREPSARVLNACPVVGTGPDEHGNWSVNTKPAEAMWPAMIDALIEEIGG